MPPEGALLKLWNVRLKLAVPTLRTGIPKAIAGVSRSATPKNRAAPVLLALRRASR